MDFNSLLNGILSDDNASALKKTYGCFGSLYIWIIILLIFWCCGYGGYGFGGYGRRGYECCCRRKHRHHRDCCERHNDCDESGCCNSWFIFIIVILGILCSNKEESGCCPSNILNVDRGGLGTQDEM